MGSSYRTGLVLSLGSVIQTTVDLHAVVPSSKSTGMNRLCPEHHLKLNQTHKCPEDGHLVDQFVLGQLTSTGVQLAPDHQRPQSSATDVLELKPISASELDDNTFDGPSLYYCKPNPATIQAWLAILAIVKKGKIALVARGALRRGSDKLWRVEAFRDYLVLREIAFPEDIREVPEVVDTKLDKGTLGLVDQFLSNLVTTWDKLDTVDRSREDLKAWLEQGDTVELHAETIDNTNAAANLIDQLQEAVAANKKQ